MEGRDFRAKLTRKVRVVLELVFHFCDFFDLLVQFNILFLVEKFELSVLGLKSVFVLSQFVLFLRREHVL